MLCFLEGNNQVDQGQVKLVINQLQVILDLRMAPQAFCQAICSHLCGQRGGKLDCLLDT